MKLSEWAKLQGVHYQTAWRWWKAGKLPVSATQMPSGTVIIDTTTSTKKVVIYSRVSSLAKKADLERQIKRCEDFCVANGYQIDKIYKEIASGMNDNRKQLNKLFDANPSTIIVEHRDRLTRFGFNYIEKLLLKANCNIIVINRDAIQEDDLMKDLVAIITSFCCRLYGLSKSTNKIKKLKEIIK